jgi:thymidine phosphorylase
MVAALGGPTNLLESPGRHLEPAPIVRPVHPERPGIVQAIATREVGVAVVALGGGRTRPQDAIDPAVGLTTLAGLGETVDGERPLGIVHARDEAAADAAAAALRQAYMVAENGARGGPLLLERLGAKA